MAGVGQSLSRTQRRRIGQMHDRGWTNGEIAVALGVCHETARVWAERWAQGEGLEDRPRRASLRPSRQTPEAIEDKVCALRCTGARSGEIAEEVGLTYQTVTAILRRRGLGLIQEPVR